MLIQAFSRVVKNLFFWAMGCEEPEAPVNEVR